MVDNPEVAGPSVKGMIQEINRNVINYIFEKCSGGTIEPDRCRVLIYLTNTSSTIQVSGTKSRGTEMLQ
jgi:hypothetical protein